MKKHFNFKSVYRTALVALCLLTVGVGNAWAGTKRIYAEYSAVSSWWGNDGRNALPYIYAWGGGHDAKKYTMTATGTSNLAYCDIDDYHTDLLFYRSTTESGSWDNQTVDISIGSNNSWSILDSETDGKKNVGSAQRWTPSAAIDGLLNPKNPHTQAFNGSGVYRATLAARSTYEFKIIDGTTLYGLNDNVWTSSVADYTLKSGEYQIRLCTAGAGTYTFTWDGANKKLSVAYPSVSHPNKDYCYIINYNWSPSTNFYPWSSGSTKVGEWNENSTIQGVIIPGTSIYNTTTIYGQSYFYVAPGEYANFLVSKNGDATDRSGDLTSSEGYGKRRYWNGSSWIWDTFTVRIQLNDLGAGTAVDPNYMDVAFNSDVLTDLTSIPVKDGYTFGGFYSGYDAENEEVTGVQVIDDSGKWIASVSDYTDASKHWIHAGMSTTIYAKWTEDKHTVNVAVSPAGAGSVQVNSSNVSSVTDVGIATKSAEMTPIALPGWKFKEWQVSSANVQLDLTEYHRDYQTSGTNSMKINATADAQTITAVFEPRYYLVGKIWDDSADGGMPGWDNYNKPFKVVTTSPVLDTCKVTLKTNESFYIEVRDKADGYSYGKSDGTLNDNTTLTFTDKDNKVFVYSNGGTEYTFKITGIDGNGRPQVSVERPYQVNVGRKRVDIDGNDHDDDTGGTVAMSLTEGGDAVSNEAWVPYGTSVKYDASAESGYSLAWFTGSDYASQFSTDATFYHIATSTGNGYAKFSEKSTSVTLANDGHGKVQISDEDHTNTTCGVTTHRELTAVPNDGYMFSSWTKTSGSDYDLSTTSDATTTLTGQGGGESSGQTVTANFTERWQLKAESEGWGSAEFTISNISTNASGDAVGYVDISLAANTNYQFIITDKQGSGAKYYSGSDQVYYMTNGNSYVWDFSTSKTKNCGITTAGAGTYRFMWNITDKTMSVIYPNFVIYRTGDKDEDSESATHTTTSAVESYDDEGPIAQAIEFRMKVRELDKWYTLCLPFTVTAVKVWDEEDGRYYDLVPYWRTGGTYYTGHYIIRTPVSTTDFAIENFDSRDRWVDPSSAGYLPSPNTPYIIQWHDGYFKNRYISFFSPTNQTIPTSMNQGANTSSDETVNIYGNNSMTSGTVRDAYMLDPDYGSGGAWMRAEVGTNRIVLPFECFIRANATTTAKYRVLRRDMADTPTGWDTVSETENKTTKVLIDNNIYIIREGRIYTIQGTLVKDGK